MGDESKREFDTNMIRDPSGVCHEIEVVEEENTGIDFTLSDEWIDTGIACDDCRGLLFDNGGVFNCNKCEREYPRL